MTQPRIGAGRAFEPGALAPDAMAEEARRRGFSHVRTMAGPLPLEVFARNRNRYAWPFTLKEHEGRTYATDAAVVLAETGETVRGAGANGDQVLGMYELLP